MDLNRVLMDADSIDDIPEDLENRFQHVRYSAINSAHGLLGMVVNKAEPFKARWGKLSYPMAGF